MSLALITGASRGIGSAVAARLVADGWQVRDLSRATGHDVTNPTIIRSEMALSSRLGAVVCCAGDVDPKPLKDTTSDEWQHSLAVNVSHQWHVLNIAAQSSMPPPVVVLIGSTAGTRPSPGWSSYSAAKAALHNLAVTANQELKNTRVYCVVPGRCATDLRAKLAPDEDPNTIMQPDEVAKVVTTCIADLAGVLAGKLIEVSR
jgi:NAD(P)-dependent dehydrogenase (short-subunit alcohol dehydrogenase family)